MKDGTTLIFQMWLDPWIEAMVSALCNLIFKVVPFCDRTLILHVAAYSVQGNLTKGKCSLGMEISIELLVWLWQSSLKGDAILCQDM